MGLSGEGGEKVMVRFWLALMDSIDISISSERGLPFSPLARWTECHLKKGLLPDAQVIHVPLVRAIDPALSSSTL